MFRIATTPETALTGKAAELFALFPPQLGAPEPLRLLTASPGLLELQAGAIGYFGGHKALSLPLLAAIRYLAARRYEAPACVEFNGRLLRLAGLDEAGLEGLAADPGSAPLEPRERAMLAFVASALDGAPAGSELDALRALGWADSDILDAVAHAGSMQMPALIVRTFKG